MTCRVQTGKPHRPRRGGRLALLALLAIPLSYGCSGKKPQTAEEYFQQATEDFQNGALDPATDKYRELLDQHPFSEHTEEAELKIAHAHYLLGNYTEAIVAFTDFQRRYPTSPHLPFVGYHLGMCYVKQTSTIDRDQTVSQSAHTYFLNVVQQYPESPFAELARHELERCRESLAGHELYVAEFYIKQNNRPAAQIRLLHVANHYGETAAAAQALWRLGQLYEEQRQGERAALAYGTLLQLHPASPQAPRARNRLAQLPQPELNGVPTPLDALLDGHGRRRADTPEIFDVQPVTARPRPSAVRMGPDPSGVDPWGERPY